MDNYFFKPDGEANHYTLFKNDNWLMSILHNGEPGVLTQEANLRVMATAFKLVEAVEEMRKLQRAYFKDRQYNIMALSKAKEKEVDKMLAELKAPARQGDIFNS